jgi:diguanylate cyclase (GGDEF)-like protein
MLGISRIIMLSTTVEAQARLLAEQARTDTLTGLPNRRTWDFEVQRMSDRTALAGVPLAVAILDLDHFKHTNDTLGHPGGDRILRACAEAWQASLGVGTVLARYGGEEFAVALPGFTATRAAATLDRVRGATPVGITVSIGIAEQLPGEPVGATLARADTALYRAKASGRDRVTIDEPHLATHR